MKAYFLLLVTMLCFLTSCEKAFFGKDKASFSRVENFEYLWSECNRNYAYFEYKKVDWDKIHSKYAAIVNEGLSQEMFFNLMRDMLNELKDGHVNLRSNFNISRYTFATQVNRTFDFQVVQNKYIGNNYYTTGPFIHGTIKGYHEVAYIRLGSFTGTVNDTQLNFILDKYKDTKGLIFDIRQNGGGVISDVYTILSHFVNEKTELWQSQIRNGENHNDFSSLQKSFVSASVGTKYFKPVIVLTDKGTFSSGSFFALGTIAIDHMITMGEATGGGLGLPNGGQLPNGWTYRFSVTRALDIAGNNWENGVPVDIPVYYNANLNPALIDTIIDKAISEIMK